MTNMKKIGLTALAASLVSTSVSAGALSVSGGASIDMSGKSGNGLNERTTYSMNDSLTFTGGGELENGLTVAVSMTLDNDENVTSSQLDSRSITLSSATLGTLVFSGEGGSSTTESIGSTVSGNIWSNFDQLTISGAANVGVDLLEAGATNDSFFYTAPAVVDGLSLFASLSPGGSTSANKSQFGYGVTFTGVEGLTASYGDANVESKTAGSSGDQKLYKASYAFGPITVGYANSSFKTGNGTTGDETVGVDSGQDATSMSVAYTLSDNLSVSYGTETLDGAGSAIDAKYQKVSAAYTTGGVTISSSMLQGDNIDYGTAADQDVKKWTLGASFAF